jgi:GT2 family glycosyltransferase
MDKKVAIIIVCYNGEKFLPECLESLERVNYPKEFLKIILVDNASEDGTADLIKRYKKKFREQCHIIFNEKNLGFAAGNNIGIKWAMGHGFDYVYLLNQDTVVHPDFLIEVIKLIEGDEKIAAVQSRLMLWSDKEKINSIGNEIHFLGFGYAGGHQLSVNSRQSSVVGKKEIAYPSGAASLWRISALKEVGYFNEEFFMYHEDLDLGWRMRIGGYRIMLAWNSVVYHKYEFSRSIRKFYFMERNRYLAILQNYKLATWLVIIIPALIMDFGMFFYSFLAGWWREELQIYKYFLDAKNCDKFIKTRKEVQAKRKVGDREVIKFFTGKIEFQEVDNPILKYLVNPVFNLYWWIVKKIIWW